MTLHKEVRKLTVDGKISDKDLARHKEELIKTLYDMLRDDGHLPLLDIDPQFSTSYDAENDVYDFVLSVYGVEGENPWDYSGTFGGRLIARHTPQTKSEPF